MSGNGFSTQSIKTWYKFLKPEKRLNSFSSPAVILCLSAGRTGTHFLSTLFAPLSGVKSVHEPNPTLSSQSFAQGALDPQKENSLLDEKVDFILKSIRKSKCSTYIETSHTLLYQTATPAPLIEKLLTRTHGRAIGVIILKRGLAEIVFSRAHLGHMSRYMSSDIVQYRGVGWIYTPGSKKAILPMLKPDDELSQLELLAGFVLNVEVISDRVESYYKAHPRVKIYKVELNDLATDVEKTTDMMDFFNLKYNKDDLIKVLQNGKTNMRKKDKEIALKRDAHTFTLEQCRTVLDEYRDRLKQRSNY